METFLVRLWKPGTRSEAPAEELHGLVQRAGRSEALVFRSDEELLATLRSGLGPARQPDVSMRERSK